MPAIFFLLQQGAERTLVHAPGEGALEATIINLVQWMRLIIETTSAVIICIGVVVALFEFARLLIPPQTEGYNRIRLTLARYLSLALEFQLGADILSTAIAPSWNQIGKLAAIAVIRTALNYFLMREMREERKNAETGENVVKDG
jgi:uncharacterized membrane protein